MKITSISDIHGTDFSYIKECDILTISGDISRSYRSIENTKLQFQDFYERIIPQVLKISKHCVIIAGNHDSFLFEIMFDKSEESFRRDLPKNIHYLRDSGVEIGGLKFYGTPWTPTFGGWPFMLSDTDDHLGRKYSMIPKNVDYLLSHGPAYGYNDKISQPIYINHNDNVSLGSKILLKHVKRAKPKNLRVGHIHTGSHKDETIINTTHNLNDLTISRNCSILDESYQKLN